MTSAKTRKIVHIDEDKCDGCGACVPNCAEGAIRIVNGKARLVADNLCDGLGACLGHCPKGAITIEERPAEGFSEEAEKVPARSKLGHWPVQLRLLPERADLWQGADVVLAADCTAYALADFHDRLLEGKTLAIACPKLDDAQFYVGKLGRILAANDVRSLTVARMEVPCCGGLVRIAELAIRASGKDIPLETVVISVRGEVASY